jgi:hypothetical protein
MSAWSTDRSMVMVVRAWVEEGREPAFRARLLQAETPEGGGGSVHVVTTSVDETIEAIRAWLEVLGADAGAPDRGDARR